MLWQNKSMLMRAPKFWSQKSFFGFLLLPLALVFCALVKLRRFFYLKIAKPKKFSIPIIVVGNISVGGTGKTPFVIWLNMVTGQA